jgi:limonene-1,2-epoxide hydrolase
VRLESRRPVTVSHTSRPSMTALATVRAFVRAIEAKDLDAALDLLADDVEYDNVPMETVRGRDGVRGKLAPFLERSSEVEWIIRREAADGDVVFNERLDRFRIAGRWVEIAVAGVWQVRNGSIVLWRDYFDLAQFREQMS